MVNVCYNSTLQSRPWTLNDTNITKAANLDMALSAAFNGSLAGNEAAVYCAVADTVDLCLGICPNADVTGVGVRVAFYLNAILTALLVGLSPDDSPSAAWSSTVLTMSLVIPAIIQKKQEALTLYHATLVLNFATFSSVSSLAVAPLCTVWRVIDNKDHPRYIDKLRSPNPPPIPLPNSRHEEQEDHHADKQSMSSTAPQRQRSRVILSFALIAQVSLQWSWATYLFTSPYYAQKACSQNTIVVLFGAPMTAQLINEHYFGLWGSWLLFSMVVTLVFGVLLVVSSTSGANGNRLPRKQLRKPKKSWLGKKVKNWDPFGDKRRRIIFGFAFVVCLLLVVVSEMQSNRNCVFGENTQWGFGQLAALLFALAPLWGIIESEKGQKLLKKMFSSLKRKDEITLDDHVDDIPDVSRTHHRDGSSAPLLPGGQHSPQASSQHSPDASSSELDSQVYPSHPLSPIDLSDPPFFSPPSTSTLVSARSNPSPQAKRPRSNSVGSDRLSAADGELPTPLGFAFRLIPPTRASSRATSRVSSSREHLPDEISQS